MIRLAGRTFGLEKQAVCVVALQVPVLVGSFRKTALRALTRDRGVPPPGHLRPEITLYRFRALQMIERSPNGEVVIYDPQ